tara:strand:- start:113 stop:271 length:159 start_codon:yes stop_codon:yes gene_type:complete
MAELLGDLLAFLIIALILLLIWSRVMGQRVIDSLMELKEFFGSFFQPEITEF